MLIAQSYYCPCSVTHDINGQLILRNTHLLTFVASEKVIQLLGKAMATATGQQEVIYKCTVYYYYLGDHLKL